MDLEKRPKVFVFDKKELVLLVLFFIFVTVTSFVLGIRFGKKQALENLQVNQETVEEVELKSEKEEYVEKQEKSQEQAPAVEKEKENVDQETFNRLQDEFEKLDKENFERREQDQQKEEVTKPEVISEESAAVDSSEVGTEEVRAESTPEEEIVSVEKVSAPLNSASVIRPDESIRGKYTIQLGSYKSLEDAQGFADAFVVRGYSPIINEVDVGARGKWYRVSIGVFATAEAAKIYINKEKSLFSNQDYVISKIK